MLRSLTLEQVLAFHIGGYVKFHVHSYYKEM